MIITWRRFLVKVHKYIDVKYINRIRYIPDQVTPNWRLEQIYQETFDTINGGKGDIKKLVIILEV